MSSNKKRVVLVHGWTGHPEYVWYPHTKRELEKRGFEVVVPALPDSHAPVLSIWLAVLREAIGEPSEDLVLIGHSLGCALILRYLEELPPSAHLRGVIFVAGLSNTMGVKELEPFFPSPHDFAKIKTHAKEFIFIHSDDDHMVPLQFGKEIHEQLGGEFILKSGAGHFSTHPVTGVACEELPEVVAAVEEMAAK